MEKSAMSKKISFAESPQESFYPVMKPITAAEEEKHHDAQEEFESRRCSHVCSLVFGAIFVSVAIAMFILGADLKLTDLYILGGILLVFGLVLVILSFVLLIRGYMRAKSANTKIFDNRIPIKQQQQQQTRISSAVTQSDVTIREITPPLPVHSRRLSHSELYSDAAIKQADISQYKSALKEHSMDVNQGRTIIQLRDNKQAQHEEVVIIHDARIALPDPDYQISKESENNTNDGVIFRVDGGSSREPTWPLPGTPDLQHDELIQDVPQAFQYVDPHSSNL